MNLGEVGVEPDVYGDQDDADLEDEVTTAPISVGPLHLSIHDF